MIIPVRCFTCGKVLADKWRYFQLKWEELKQKKEEDNNTQHVDFFFEDTACGDILDDLGLYKICCRRHMLSHVDLVDII